MLEVVLGAQVGHRRERVVLGQGTVGAGGGATTTTSNGKGRGSSDVLGRESTSVQAERRMQGQQRPADLGVRGGVDLATLGVAEELVQVVIPALASVKRGRLVGHEVSAGAHGLLVVQRLVRLGLVVSVVTSMPAILVRLAERCRVGTDMTVVVIVAGRGYGKLALKLEEPVRNEPTLSCMAAVGGVQTTAVILRGPANDHGVVGVGLDVLLQVLGTLEGLAAEVTLVRLERDMDTDMRRDVITLDGSSPAGVPLAGQIEVVGALSAYMSLADVVLRNG